MLELPQLPAVDRQALVGLEPCRGFRAALKRPLVSRFGLLPKVKNEAAIEGHFRGVKITIRS